ncbi:MAG: RagB/SusD family nutrient uptake outer membrane protein [Candidatus Ordinivivax streblomastigis]|uniref:RagB/SusD family nutrient uptake outer membrane protein n=1 Tax=Candidatus Ordinivivax streblomastigis TaxID=2540710 RepID=A0A5M8NUD5_9BACT|nr:MAG: RagB/SusD family nutrient uptake outer membrane protein [Candidatus Ordinivivax streblomastigis]
MKKIFLSVVLIALLSVTLFSCEDNDKPDNGNEDTVLTAAEASALVNAAYVPLQWVSSLTTYLADGLTETATAVYDEDAGAVKITKFDVDEQNDIAIELFNGPYASIGAANLAIKQIEAAAVSKDLTQEQKDYQIARAKFIRGYNYFQLVQTYGEVPVILESDTIAGERKPIDDVYAQAVKDLTEAAENLPAYEAQKSIPSQAAVNAVLARLYLTWGQKPVTRSEIEAIASSKTDPAKPAPDNAKLQKAIEYADKVINSGKYNLLSNFNNIWGANHENNDEVIFSVRHDGDDIDGAAGGFGNHQTHCGFTWPKEPKKDPHISYTDVTLKDRISDVNDSRKLLSYVTRLEYEDGAVDSLDWPVSVVRAGKWIHRTADNVSKATLEQPNNIDRIDYRYAEVLLIKAEALFFLNRIEDAATLVNQVRQRAGVGVPHLHTITANDLYNEWDYEFAFEHKRWYNLVRWRTYLKTVSDALAGFEYIKDTYGSEESIKAAFPDVAGINYPLYIKLHNNQLAKKNKLAGKFYRLPIPTGYEYESLGITPQNPGY